MRMNRTHWHIRAGRLISRQKVKAGEMGKFSQEANKSWSAAIRRSRAARAEKSLHYINCLGRWRREPKGEGIWIWGKNLAVCGSRPSDRLELHQINRRVSIIPSRWSKLLSKAMSSGSCHKSWMGHHKTPLIKEVGIESAETKGPKALSKRPPVP